MKIKTSELSGPALDWAVAKCEGFDTRNNCVVEYMNPQDSDDVLEFPCGADDEAHAMEQLYDAYPESSFISAIWSKYEPSTDWAVAGPIIEREGVELGMYADQWQATMHLEDGSIFERGPTPLIAAMRCFVASRLGDTVEIPDALA